MSDELKAHLRSSAKAFRENTVYTGDDDPIRLIVQADECDQAADRIAALEAAIEPLATMFGAANMSDPLDKWLTIGTLARAHELLTDTGEKPL